MKMRLKRSEVKNCLSSKNVNLCLLDSVESTAIHCLCFYNNKSSFSLGVFTVEPICMQLWAC